MSRLLPTWTIVTFIASAASAAPATLIAERHLIADTGAATIEGITYISDGLSIRGYLAIPKGLGPFPATIYNRGGNFTLGVWDDDHAVKALGGGASWGYVVVASQYRGAGGSEGHDDYGGADVDDVLNLIPVLDSLPQVDRNRIGMFGSSRGGMMTYLALTRTDRIRAAAVLSGLSDLFENGRSRSEMEMNFKRFMPDYLANREEALRKRSAIRWVNKLPANVPILLVHGTADWRVSPSQAFDLARALAESQRPVRLMIFEGGSHGVPEFQDEENAAVHAWFDTYLRDGKKWPDLKPHGQ